MAKHGRNNRGGNSQPQRYKGKNVDMMGDPGRMERHAIDVFRDMSRGKYNFNNISEFLNREFVLAAIIASQKQLRIHQILKSALEYAYGNSDDNDVMMLKNRELVSCQGWETIIQSLYIVLNTQDLGTVYGMANRLSANRDLRL